MPKKSFIIYLIGKPGTGKYTIAKALAAKYGFIVCDNQLINNPIFKLLQYDGYAKIPGFAWDSIDKIREVVFDFLTQMPDKDYVLTNCLWNNSEDLDLYNQVEKMAQTRGSTFIPIHLVLSKQEHVKRLTRPERRERWKSIDPKDADDDRPLLTIDHPNFIELDVTDLSPEEAAQRLVNQQ